MKTCKKLRHRIIALCLSFCMALSLMPNIALASRQDTTMQRDELPAQDEASQPSGGLKILTPAADGRFFYTYQNAKYGRQYVMRVIEGVYKTLDASEDITQVSKLLYIDQRKATSSTVSFNGFVPKGDGDATVLISEEGKKAIIVGYIVKEPEKLEMPVTVTFDLQGHGIKLPEHEPYTATFGSIIKEPTAPEDDKYVFFGWYKDSECTEKWDFNNDMVMDDTILYASWGFNGLWVSGVREYTYAGKAIKPKLNVFYSNIKLKEGLDYTVVYKNNIKAAESNSGKKAPTIVIKGKGNYSGSISTTFTIKPATLTSSNIVAATTYPVGIAYTPAVLLNGVILKANKDYTIKYLDESKNELGKRPVEEGTYYIRIVGKDNCTNNTIDFKYTIAENGKIDIQKGKATVENMVYGDVQKPDTTLKVKDTTLVKNQDYNVTFSGTDAKGTATAIFTGRGDYTGVLRKTFKVSAASIENSDITLAQSAAYEKGGVKPEVTVTMNDTKLSEGLDYTVRYTKNTKLGTANVIVSGKGNYNKKRTLTFQVTSKNLNQSGIDIFVSDAAAKNKPSVVIFDTNGKKLSASSDYKADIDKNQHNVTISEGKNKLYTNTSPKVIQYKEADADKVIKSVKLNKNASGVPKNFSYTGNEIELDSSWLTVKAGRTTLNNTDFTIASYKSNIDKGTAYAVVKGRNSYTGTAVLSFKIGAQKLTGSIDEWLANTAGGAGDDIVIPSSNNCVIKNLTVVTGSGINADITVTADKDCSAYVATYNSKGKMLEVGSCTINSDTGEQTVNINLSSTGDIVRAFLLDNETTAPLCEKYEIDISNKEPSHFELKADKDSVFIGDNLYLYLETDALANSILVSYVENGNTKQIYLYDDGTSIHSDDMLGDGIYSGKINTSTSTDIDTDVEFTASYGSHTSSTTVKYYAPLTDDDYEEMEIVNTEIDELISSDEFINKTETEKYNAVEGFINKLEEDNKILKDSINTDTDSKMVTFQYPEGILGGIAYGEFKDDTTSETSVLAANGTANETDAGQVDDIGSAIILNSFQDFGTIINATVDSQFYENLKSEWDNSGLKTVLDTDVTVEDYKNLDNYNVIYLATYGNMYPWMDSKFKLHTSPVICLSEKATKEKDKKYSMELKDKQIAKVNGCYWILPSFFEKQYEEQAFDKSFVISECVDSLGILGKYNSTDMAEAFLNRSAKAYIGFHNFVIADHRQTFTKNYVNNLINGQKSKPAFDSANEGTSFWTDVAYPSHYGDENAVLLEDTLKNGDFELFIANQPSNWTCKGDVRTLLQLGHEILPCGENSKRMAILTTGIGSGTSTEISDGTEGSIISQTFRVPSNASKLYFDYNFISEEPMEWVGSMYNDYFTVRISQKGNIAFDKKLESINTSTWHPVTDIDFQGGDSTTYQTLWKKGEIDVSEYSGSIITLSFVVYDVGDQIYDSACVIDNVVLK